MSFQNIQTRVRAMAEDLLQGTDPFLAASIAATVIEACGFQAPSDYEPSLIALNKDTV